MRIITTYKLFEKIMSRDELLTNAIRKEGIIEPALMTSEEYLEYLGANKHHPDDAYLFSIRENSIISDDDLRSKYTLLNNIKQGSIFIKYYVGNGSEFSKNRYVKRDENGEVIYDENKMAVLMSAEEIKQAGYTHDRNVIAVLNNNIIGSAQDEWGCVLVYVVKELWGLGIGNRLVEYYRSYYPNKTSGGTTTSGYNNLKKYHKKQIKKYSSNGIYSDMVRNGEISYDRVKEIVNSVSDIRLTTKKNIDNIYLKYYHSKQNYNRAFIFNGNDIMLINDDIIKYYKDYDIQYKNIDDDYSDFVFGHCRIHREDNDEYRLYFLDGKSERDLENVIKYALSYVKIKYNKDYLLYFITENSEEITKDFILRKYSDTKFDNNKYIISEKDLNIMKLCSELKRDTIWFYSIDDQYGELRTRISENVYSTFQN